MPENQVLCAEPLIHASAPLHSDSETVAAAAAFPAKLFPFFSAVLAAFCLVIGLAGPAAAQSPAPQPAPAQAQPALPDAPQPQNATPRRIPPGPPVPWIYARLRTPGKPLTARQKFRIYVYQTYGPPAIVGPAVGAGLRMARPNDKYPPSWKDGPEAFGRLYGSTLATQTSKHTAEFLTEAAFHYDARYYPSHSDWTILRILHAWEYVALEKTDSGATRVALPHFAGAAAGGFVGMAYMPPGYNTLSYAGQRAGSELLSTGLRNLAQEFAPELAPIARKIHLPRFIPVWWTPLHPAHQSTPGSTP